jgi:hypothetical protein
MDNKQELEKRFNELYPGKRLLEINLNGFYHSIWYDDGSRNSEVQQEISSNYLAVGEFPMYPKAMKLFEGYLNSQYQNNDETLNYIKPEKR